MSLTMSLTEYVRSRLICSPNDVCSLWRHRARSLRPASLAFSRAWWHKQIKLTRSWSCLFYHAQTTPYSEYNLLQPSPGGQHLIKLWNLHNIKLLIIVLVYTKPANSQQKKQNECYLVKTQLERWLLTHASNQWIVQDIPSLSSKSEQAEMLDNHWFGIYSCTKLNYYQQTNKEGGKFAGKGLPC